jgi:hypothetical protein
MGEGQDRVSYYDRQGATHVDGSAIFRDRSDIAAEKRVADQIATRWNCEVRPFGALSPVDWFAVRHGRMVGVLELKHRDHASDRFKTVFLNVRKWLALQLASVGLGVPALYVVEFTDGVYFANVNGVDGKRHGMGGCLRIVKSASDVEPVIHVDVAGMRPLAPKETP